MRVDDQDFARRTRVLPFISTSTGMPLDVVLAGSGLEDEFLSRARHTEVLGTMLPIIDLADLIIAKVLAGRPKDVDAPARSGGCMAVRSTPIASDTRCGCLKKRWPDTGIGDNANTTSWWLVDWLMEGECERRDQARRRHQALPRLRRNDQDGGD